MGDVSLFQDDLGLISTTSSFGNLIYPGQDYSTPNGWVSWRFFEFIRLKLVRCVKRPIESWCLTVSNVC